VTIANSSTPTLRANLWDWFSGALLKRLEPDSKVIVVGARFFEDDLYGKLKELSKENGGDWKVLEYSASPEEPLWPERFDSKALMEAYRNDPILFPAQYMQKPLSSTRGILKKDWLQFYIQDTIDTEDMAIFAGVDPCRSGKAGTDEFAIAVGAFDGTTTYLIDLISGSYPPSQQLEIIKEMAERYRPALINIEEDYSVAEMLKEQTDFRVNASSSLISKELRIKNLGSLALKGKLMIPGKIADDGTLGPAEKYQAFCKQWEEFPACKHDDLLDAVEKLMEAVSIGIEPAAVVSDAPTKIKSNLLFHNEVII